MSVAIDPTVGSALSRFPPMPDPTDKTRQMVPPGAQRSHERTVIDSAAAGPLGVAGRYRLIRKLGQGGMAEAFAAEAVGVDGFVRTVALKRTLPEYGSDEGFARAFINEAKIAARLSHPNVVQVIDLDRDSAGRLFLVMEFVDGCDLDRLLESGARLPWPVIVYVIACVLRGLTAAHELTSDNGRPLVVVHRDVSPHNVFISFAGAVKLGDWGIAKRSAVTSSIAQGTREGVVKGKLAYMAPEQARGQALDGRADLYAVGVMLWEMLTGRPFMSPGTQDEQLAWILYKPIVSPSTVAADVPADLERVAMMLLERDPDHRYPSAREAIAALESCAAAEVGASDALADLVAARSSGNSAARTQRAAAPARGRRPRAGRGRLRAVTAAAAIAVLAVAVMAGVALGRRGAQSPHPSSSSAPSAPAAAIAIDAGAVVAPPAVPALTDATLPPSIDAAPPIDAAPTRDAGPAVDAAPASHRRPAAGKGSGSSGVESYNLGGG